MAGLTHFDAGGAAHMVDVSGKPATARKAVARGSVSMAAETLARVMEGTAAKGDVLGVARLAGIMGAKQTSTLIPLCHPLPLTKLAVDLEPQGDRVRIVATAVTNGVTGVEMEALTAATIASLTLYDMIKAVDNLAIITDVKVLAKSGGKSGEWSIE